MGNWVYVRSEPSLFTVGFHDPDGRWHPDGDWGTSDEAARRVRHLNGGPDVEVDGQREASGIQTEYERLERAARTLAERVDELEAAWRTPGQNLEVAAHQLWEPRARATVAVLRAHNALRAALSDLPAEEVERG